MGFGAVENISAGEPLDAALSRAFARLRAAGTSGCAVVFDAEWRPTMDIVELVSQELAEAEDIQTLALVHPSAAMTFIASAIGVRVPNVQISAQRSLHDEIEDENTDATASKTVFVMERGEHAEAFVRRAIGEARTRVARRFALVFDAGCTPSIDLADVLAEELMRSSVKEIGLVHPRAPLETIVASLRLRLPHVRVAFASGTAQPRR
jgi:hypothetical protein